MTKPKKLPPNTPERGDRCCLRGRKDATGVLQKYDPKSQWATVLWDDGVAGPKLCHRFELVTVAADQPVAGRPPSGYTP